MKENGKKEIGKGKNQRGGFAVGLIIGLLIGLALALGVALYVTKVPVPFINKVPQRTTEQDAAETAKNKNWDPNSPLYGKNPARGLFGSQLRLRSISAASCSALRCGTLLMKGTGTLVT